MRQVTRSRWARASMLAIALVVAPLPARASEDDTTKRARAEFVSATDHVRSARWGEALAAFERSAALRPHALTTYNIAACERALGRYMRARESLRRALEADAASSGKELPRTFADEAKRWMTEIDALVVKVTVALAPADATLLVDGAALVKDGDHFKAGLASSGEAQEVKTPGPAFTMQIDPGDHVLSISRSGYAGAVLQKRFAPGSLPRLDLDVRSLPAEIKVSANVPGAVVSVDDLDSGVVPVQLTRPAGVYRVAVKKLGFVPYVTTVKVNAGEQPSLQATLAPESSPVYRRWWFWVGAAAIVAGAAVGTYLVARPDPERPTPDGGGLGWVVTVPAGP